MQQQNWTAKDRFTVIKVKLPMIQLQAPSQSPTGATIAWRFPQADGSSPPNWLDQGRASELSCGRGTERVLDRYPLHL